MSTEERQDLLGESTEYVSESTIDNPPPPPEKDEKPKKLEQGSLFDKEELDDKHREYLATNTPGQVSYKLTLAIDGGHFKNTIVFSGEKVPSEYFCEYLMQSLQGGYFSQQIRGICGEQEFTPKQEALPLTPTRGDSNPEVAPVSAETQAAADAIDDAEEQKSPADRDDDWNDDASLAAKDSDSRDELAREGKADLFADAETGDEEVAHVDTVDHEKVLRGQA